MREYLRKLGQEKKAIQVNFAASAGAKLISITGNIGAVAEDHLILLDIYNNTMLVPYPSIAYIEVKK